MREVVGVGSKNPTPILSADTFDPEALLSIQTIREYTKTDDVPHVTDEQLALYRSAAIEAAELYTGRLLSKQRVITEELQLPSLLQLQSRRKFKHYLSHPTADGVLYIFGGLPGGERQVLVTPGATEFTIPLDGCSIDLTSCCGANGRVGTTTKVMYRAGYTGPEAIPSGIILGCLKFIAWTISNPGDAVMTVKDSSRISGAAVLGTNNGAWASGAIEQWRMYTKEA